jgi:hypothetical protein
MAESAPAPRRFSWRVVFLGGLLGALFALGWEISYILLGSNLREVIPGHLYRAAQPDPALLADAQRLYGVRTVLSLRGNCDGDAWYGNELRAAEELGLSMEVVALSAGRMLSPSVTRDLCEILDRAEPPLLVHCQRGIDRTGLVCALYLLLRTDACLEQARGQLSLRYLHLNVGRTRAMDRFLDLYAEWLSGQGLEHNPDYLRRWLRHEYRPPQGLAEIALAASPESPTLSIPRSTPTAVPVRVRNCSPGDLCLAPSLMGGMFLRWTLTRTDRSVVLMSQPGGLRKARVVPGGTIDLAVYLPAIAEPGHYRLTVELYDIAIGSFCMVGADPLVVELEVP